MQAESAVNAVATPTGAPTCPPCVASSAGLAQVSGAHEPGVLGSQPEAPGPHASTVPPPVTRQPSNARAASLAPNTSTSARRVPTTPVRVFTRTPRPLIVVIGSPVVEASQCAVWPLRTSEGSDRMFYPSSQQQTRGVHVALGALHASSAT